MSALIAQLFDRHAYAEVTARSIDAFAAGPGTAMLVFTEDPLCVRETLDLAVIVPELARAFAGQFRVGVLLPEAARALQPRYGFRRWPALVMVRDGAYVGAIDGLRTWNEYVTLIDPLLSAPPARPPTSRIPIAQAGARQRQ
ncbi:MAG: hydrogenase-1 expression HyaE [Burkholderiales bacterium]